MQSKYWYPAGVWLTSGAGLGNVREVGTSVVAMKKCAELARFSQVSHTQLIAVVSATDTGRSMTG